MKKPEMKRGCRGDRPCRQVGLLFAVASLVMTSAQGAFAHIVEPENFHPVVESYRRSMFLLNLNPILWNEVRADTNRIADGLESISQQRAEAYRKAVAAAVVRSMSSDDGDVSPASSREAARAVFELNTRAVAELMRHQLEALKASTGDRKKAAALLDLSRKYWEGFEYEVKCTDVAMFREIGLCWLKIATALGSAPLLGQGETPVDAKTIHEEADEILVYLKSCYLNFTLPEKRSLAPAPYASKSYDARATIPPKLPPGSDINKQRPRPRQILNLVARGVDETDTPLVALGDMAFDSSLIFGEPARSFGISCNNCHNKSITNPNFVVPGLSSRLGGMDVSNSFFAPHANNGHFDPLDIPDLRGIRFTGPYGRNGRFSSLRDFVRNVIVNEFNGPEPDPIILDAMLAYMMEFDFLPNPLLADDGRLKAGAPEAARRGEALFNKKFAQMNDMSCASCHIPSSYFVDGQRHDIGSVTGPEVDSIDGALDTPTLLSSRFTAPYFHDGSLSTLEDVVRWFDDKYKLELKAGDVADLTAYLEVVGDGVDPYEEDPDMASPGEVEEQYFFMASWEFLRDKGKFDLADIVFRTVAQELRNEKWGLRYSAATEVVESMAQLADAAIAANKAGEVEVVDAKVAEFRAMFEANAELIAGEVEPEAAEPRYNAAGDAVNLRSKLRLSQDEYAAIQEYVRNDR